MKNEFHPSLPNRPMPTEYDMSSHTWSFAAESAVFEWKSPMERVLIIRKGIPYDAIDALSKKLHKPIKSLLQLFHMAQTTYNKKKSEHALLDSKESELILLIAELIAYGAEVFNHEEPKFLRWLKKPNLSLGGHAPESFFDTASGVQEVMACLHRLEYGNLS
jgi:putative toxin-antitoxin system antitoxin component (TIGR02293 family)